MKLNKKFVYAKYIFGESKRHKDFRGQASQGIAINLLHDAAEIAMIAVAEDLSIKDRHNGLMDLIKKVEDKESNKIGHSRFLGILNSLRNNFKHGGILPSREQLWEVITLGVPFFEEVSDNYYGLEFSKVSLTSLIENEEIREHIKNAEGEFEKGSYANAVIECSIAKAKLNLNDDIGLKIEHIFPMSSNWKHFISPPSSMDFDLADLIKDSTRSFQEIYRHLYLFYLGVDFKEYNQFLSLLAGVVMSPYTKDYQIQLNPLWESRINKETSRFFIDFFAEFVLKIQEG